MNRLLLPVLFFAGVCFASVSEAGIFCAHKNRCATSCGTAPVCCPTQVCCPAPAPVTQTICQTTYRHVWVNRVVTRYRKVVCRDECGRCIVKCVPYRCVVRVCCRVPVTTYRTVTVCPPRPTCCVTTCCPTPRTVCCPPTRTRCIDRLRARFCCN